MKPSTLAKPAGRALRGRWRTAWRPGRSWCPSRASRGAPRRRSCRRSRSRAACSARTGRPGRTRRTSWPRRTSATLRLVTRFGSESISMIERRSAGSRTSGRPGSLAIGSMYSVLYRFEAVLGDRQLTVGGQRRAVPVGQVVDDELRRRAGWLPFAASCCTAASRWSRRPMLPLDDCRVPAMAAMRSSQTPVGLVGDPAAARFGVGLGRPLRVHVALRAGERVVHVGRAVGRARRGGGRRWRGRRGVVGGRRSGGGRRRSSAGWSSAWWSWAGWCRCRSRR